MSCKKYVTNADLKKDGIYKSPEIFGHEGNYFVDHPRGLWGD